jgi:hypothetical protein
VTVPLFTDQRVWCSERRTFMDGGVRRPLRLVAFATGWLASADSASGPTMAADRSPFLAAWRALEPMGIDLVEAIAIVGNVPRLKGASLAEEAS